MWNGMYQFPTPPPPFAIYFTPINGGGGGVVEGMGPCALLAMPVAVV